MNERQGDAGPDTIVKLLGLSPHPEGGFYKETFRDSTGGTDRSISTAIYFLLSEGQVARWHRVDSTEVWHWYAGAPLRLTFTEPGTNQETVTRLGNRLESGERPQAIVPANAWQSAESLGSWTLTGCTVAPGFEFLGFELAPEGWTPVNS
ncbi:hypothetical protein MnTg02_03116 [bacterium MnTg02]|nr:hypothetical protein MnTg02_03116 [bacterium MnTg02]